jgi:YYY domain-containing protein
VLVVLAAFVLFLPFHLTFQSLVGFKEPLIDVPVLGRLTTIIAPFLEDNTSLHSFLIIFGLFVVPLVALVYCHLGTSHGTPRPVWEARLSIWGPPLLLLVGLLVGFPLLALAGLGLVAFVAALRHVAAPAVSFVLLVVALGCAVVFGTDVVYIRDVFEGGSARLNTLFKFYYQVWLLWGTTAPFALWWLWQARQRPADAASTSRKPARVVVYAVSGLCALLLAGALVYPAINLRNVAQDGTWTGLAGRTPREIHPAEAEAMQWLRAHAAPGSVVLEMVGPGGGSYNNEGYAAIAAATGRPTVLGWVGHQRQWRGGDSAARAQLDPRMADVETIYSTTDAQVARELLQTYDVDYVYVGQLEQQAYAPEALAKFAEIGEPVHFQDGAVTIYRLHNQ